MGVGVDVADVDLPGHRRWRRVDRVRPPDVVRIEAGRGPARPSAPARAARPSKVVAPFQRRHRGLPPTKQGRARPGTSAAVVVPPCCDRSTTLFLTGALHPARPAGEITLSWQGRGQGLGPDPLEGSDVHQQSRLSRPDQSERGRRLGSRATFGRPRQGRLSTGGPPSLAARLRRTPLGLSRSLFASRTQYSRRAPQHWTHLACWAGAVRCAYTDARGSTIPPVPHRPNRERRVRDRGPFEWRTAMQDERSRRLGPGPTADEGRPTVGKITRLSMREPEHQAARSRPRRRSGKTATTCPAPLTSFVGREREIAEVGRLLGAAPPADADRAPAASARPAWRSQVAGRAAGPLSPTASGWSSWRRWPTRRSSPPAVAPALGVREQPGRAAARGAAAARCATAQLLLVLDNCEHLVDACAALADDAAAGLPRPARPGHQPRAAGRRRRGDLAGAVAGRARAAGVAADAGPAAPGAPSRLLGAARVRGGPAVRRAGAGRPRRRFALTDAERRGGRARSAGGWTASRWRSSWRRRGCAALAPSRSPPGWTTASGCSTGGSRTALPRQQTLRALVDWSHDLLRRRSGRCFRRLAVFAGGWTLEAAEASAPASGAGARRRPSSPADVLDLLRWSTSRWSWSAEQAAARCATGCWRRCASTRGSGSRRAARRRSSGGGTPTTTWRWPRTAEPRLFGAEQAAGSARLERRARQPAARRSAGSSEARRASTRRCGWPGALAVLAGRGYLREGRAWLERLLAPAGAARADAGRARALNAVGFLAFLQGDYDAAQPLLEESLAIRRALDDRQGIAESLNNLGLLLRCVGARRGASLFDEALAAVGRWAIAPGRLAPSTSWPGWPSTRATTRPREPARGEPRQRRARPATPGTSPSRWATWADVEPRAGRRRGGPRLLRREPGALAGAGRRARDRPGPGRLRHPGRRGVAAGAGRAPARGGPRHARADRRAELAIPPAQPRAAAGAWRGGAGRGRPTPRHGPRGAPHRRSRPWRRLWRMLRVGAGRRARRMASASGPRSAAGPDTLTTREARGGSAGRAGAEQPPDRRGAGRRRADGPRPRRQHPRQASASARGRGIAAWAVEHGLV